MGYLGIVAFGRLPDRFILWPQVQREPNHGAEQMLFPMGKGRLEIWRAGSSVVTQEPDVFILRFYGNADRADHWVAEEAKAFPGACELWGVNYPGFGGSTGPASLKGVAESAITAYDALRTRAGSKPILVFGTSLGTTAESLAPGGSSLVADSGRIGQHRQRQTNPCPCGLLVVW